VAGDGAEERDRDSVHTYEYNPVLLEQVDRGKGNDGPHFCKKGKRPPSDAHPHSTSESAPENAIEAHVELF